MGVALFEGPRVMCICTNIYIYIYIYIYIWSSSSTGCSYLRRRNVTGYIHPVKVLPGTGTSTHEGLVPAEQFPGENRWRGEQPAHGIVVRTFEDVTGMFLPENSEHHRWVRWWCIKPRKEITSKLVFKLNQPCRTILMSIVYYSREVVVQYLVQRKPRKTYRSMGPGLTLKTGCGSAGRFFSPDVYLWRGRKFCWILRQSDTQRLCVETQHGWIRG